MCVISVVVPVYKVEKDIERCIASILGQTFSDFELLLINDGSPDKSGDICRAAAEKDGRIKYFEKPNGGLASARNYGMSRASGEFICFVDSDDYIDAECLEFCLSKIRKTQADMVLCGYIMENGKSASYVVPEAGIYRGAEINSAMAQLKRKNLIDPAWNKFYRRDFLEKNGMQFPEGEIYEDTDFNLRLLRAKPEIAVSDKCFYHYVLHMGSITRRYNPEKLATIKRRALLLKEVTEGIEPYCDYYYIKSVFSAVMDMFLCCKKSDIMRVITAETADPAFRAAAGNAAGSGKAASLTVRAAKSCNPARIYRFCKLAYILKFKLQRLFLRVRE